MRILNKSRYQRSKISHLYLDTTSGIYYARASDVQGRDVWRSLETTVFSVAKARLGQKVAEIQAGKKVGGHHHREIETFGQIAVIYFGRVQADVTIKPRTIDYRREIIEALERSWPELNDRKLSTITSDECLKWAAEYQKKVHSTRYNNTVDTLRLIFEIGRECGVIIENPAAKIGKVKVTPKRLELPSRDQFHALILAMRNAGGWCSHEAADLVEFIAYSGCRIDETRHITWKDLDDATGRIWIHGHNETGTKNSEPRSIPILPPMRDLLDRLQRKDKQPRAVHRRGAGYVLQVADCYRALKRACAKVEIKRLSHHDLRHLFATRCIEAGVDIPTVSRWLGHKDGGALAMKTYGHLRDEHSQAMAAKVIF